MEQQMQPHELCPCGNYMPRPRTGPDGVQRCSACHSVATRQVEATTRLNLGGASFLSYLAEGRSP